MHRAGCYQGSAPQSAGCAVMFSAVHSAHLYQLSCNNTAKPTKSCPIKKIDACRMLTAPRANGLFFVLSTARSRRASHMSLIVHPAPRMTTAPVKNRAIFQRGSKGEGSEVMVRADSVMDQARRCGEIQLASPRRQGRMPAYHRAKRAARSRWAYQSG